MAERSAKLQLVTWLDLALAFDVSARVIRRSFTDPVAPPYTGASQEDPAGKDA
jgi:hypothetical protein